MRMNSTKKILVAFILNLCFSCFEFIGGFLTGSVAILSDSVHDFGDAVSIGLSYALEKKSKKHIDAIYTYGYARYSAIGSLITTMVLIFGSLFMIIEAIERLISPITIDSGKMILFAIVGVIVNTVAAIITIGKESDNQKAVNLHMIEDVLGWIVVLIGALVMQFTGLTIFDPILSIVVSIFILINAIKHCRKTIDTLLEKSIVDTRALTKELKDIDGIERVHHLHVWSIDSTNHCATVHVVASTNQKEIKNKIRELFARYDICHVTIEIEAMWEYCEHQHCNLQQEEVHCSCCANTGKRKEIKYGNLQIRDTRTRKKASGFSIFFDDET